VALCIDYQYLNLCEHLLDRSGDKVLKDEIGKTPLHYAAYNGNLAVLRILIDNATDRNPRFCELDPTEI
jgi:ankyrin repeat protein